MSAGDDSIPTAYPYTWTPDSDISLQDFLTKYKPSMVQDDGTKPWLWVRNPARARENENIDAAIKEAAEYLKEITEKIEEIQNDQNIPLRANKKKGLKSKKELREEIQAEATEKLKEISIRHGYIEGKWLVFAPGNKVDNIWSTVATSLVSGPLSHTCADTAKVSTCPKNETPNYTHVICLYMPDVYDKDSVTQVMKVLLGKHGLTLMGVKSELYTLIGLDSKHASGVPSSVWKNTALLPDAQIKDLKDKFFAEQGASKGTATDKLATSVPAKKPVLKKKVADEDPFASDDEDKGDDAKTAEKAGAKETKPPAGPSKVKPQPKPKKPEDNAFGSDNDTDEAEAEKVRKAEVAAKKTTAKTKTTTAVKRSKDEDSDDEEDRPKRRKGTGRR